MISCAFRFFTLVLNTFVLQATQNDKEMSFLARFQVYEMFKVQLKCRLELRKILREKPEILEVSIKIQIDPNGLWHS